MKGYLIDPVERSVTEVELATRGQTQLESLYALLRSHSHRISVIELNRWSDGVYVSNDRRCAYPGHFFLVNKEPFSGFGVVLGAATLAGGATEPMESIEAVRARISWYLQPQKLTLPQCLRECARALEAMPATLRDPELRAELTSAIAKLVPDARRLADECDNPDEYDAIRAVLLNSANALDGYARFTGAAPASMTGLRRLADRARTVRSHVIDKLRCVRARTRPEPRFSDTLTAI